MQARIDLFWMGTQPPNWTLGSVQMVAAANVVALHAAIQQHLNVTQAEYWLFWDACLGIPNADQMSRLTTLPGHLWHAGLKLGIAGKPALFDFVSPTWMLNRDPDQGSEATSWRMSLRACLTRVDVMRQMGSINPAFATLSGAALELGHRYISNGVLMRYIPWMVDQRIDLEPLPLVDEIRCLRCRVGRVWNFWALGRAVLSGHTSLTRAITAWRAARNIRPSEPAKPFNPQMTAVPLPANPAVTVLIPTVERYPYLRTLLGQMRVQTVAPAEIIIVDQTEPTQRDNTLAAEFSDLPIKLITLGVAGQCTSRNSGLQVARGDYILFIDDDDEVEPDLIERHLRNLESFQADVSSGAAHEVGAGALPKNFTYRRASDVFPTNNTMIRKAVLLRSGLFDLAYERMQRADGDFGMRIYLTGAFMIYNPAIAVLHHHAPSGGLRKHKARVVTYASSRKSLTQRHLVSISEIYLGLRYFSRRQVREDLWIHALGSFAIRGSRGRKLLKAGLSLIRLPDTIWYTRRAYNRAVTMLEYYPQIPALTVTPTAPSTEEPS